MIIYFLSFLLKSYLHAIPLPEKEREEVCRRISSLTQQMQGSETEEELKRQVEDLKAEVAFLKFWSPTHRHLSGRSHGPGFTDVALVAVADGPDGGPSMPVLAPRAILVSVAFCSVN